MEVGLEISNTNMWKQSHAKSDFFVCSRAGSVAISPTPMPENDRAALHRGCPERQRREWKRKRHQVGNRKAESCAWARRVERRKRVYAEKPGSSLCPLRPCGLVRKSTGWLLNHLFIMVTKHLTQSTHKEGNLFQLTGSDSSVRSQLTPWLLGPQ